MRHNENQKPEVEIPLLGGTDAIAELCRCSRRSVQLALRSGIIRPDAFYVTPTGRKVAVFTESTVAKMAERLVQTERKKT